MLIIQETFNKIIAEKIGSLCRFRVKRESNIGDIFLVYSKIISKAFELGNLSPCIH